MLYIGPWQEMKLAQKLAVETQTTTRTTKKTHKDIIGRRAATSYHCNSGNKSKNKLLRQRQKSSSSLPPLYPVSSKEHNKYYAQHDSDGYEDIVLHEHNIEGTNHHSDFKLPHISHNRNTNTNNHIHYRQTPCHSSSPQSFRDDCHVIESTSPVTTVTTCVPENYDYYDDVSISSSLTSSFHTTDPNTFSRRNNISFGNKRRQQQHDQCYKYNQRLLNRLVESSQKLPHNQMNNDFSSFWKWKQAEQKILHSNEKSTVESNRHTKIMKKKKKQNPPPSTPTATTASLSSKSSTTSFTRKAVSRQYQQQDYQRRDKKTRQGRRRKKPPSSLSTFKRSQRSNRANDKTLIRDVEKMKHAYMKKNPKNKALSRSSKSLSPIQAPSQKSTFKIKRSNHSERHPLKSSLKNREEPDAVQNILSYFQQEQKPSTLPTDKMDTIISTISELVFNQSSAHSSDSEYKNKNKTPSSHDEYTTTTADKIGSSAVTKIQEESIVSVASDFPDEDIALFSYNLNHPVDDLVRWAGTLDIASLDD